MRVIKQSSAELEMTHMPIDWLVGLGGVVAILGITFLRALSEGALNGIIMSSLLLAALGWILMTQILRQVVFHADRRAGTLRIRSRAMFGDQVAEYPLPALKQLEGETQHNRRHSLPEYRLLLVLAQGDTLSRVPLDLFRPDPLDLLYAVSTLNSWLDPSESVPEQPGSGVEGALT